MFCRHCGATLADNTKFCRSCGNPVQQVAPAAPAEPPVPVAPPQPVAPAPAPAPTPVPAPAPAPKKAPEPKSDKPKKKGKAGKIIALVVALLLVAVLAFGALVYFDVIEVPFVDNLFVSMGLKGEDSAEDEEKKEDIPHADDTIPDRDYLGTGELGQSYEVPYVDMNEYYKDKATIVSTVPVASATAVRSESEIYADLTARGFIQTNITTEYGMDGSLYSSPATINSYSSTRHPIYETTYVTAAGEIWYITECNGSIYAMPLVYNMNSENAPVYFSETDSITAYDCASNAFYTIKPNDTFAVIKTVDTINAETLESLVLGGN